MSHFCPGFQRLVLEAQGAGWLEVRAVQNAFQEGRQALLPAWHAGPPPLTYESMRVGGEAVSWISQMMSWMMFHMVSLTILHM